MTLWRKRFIRILFVVGVGLVILPSYLRLYSLTGGSMAPTILRGDRFIVNRAAYSLQVPYSRVMLFHIRSPRRGDIVQAQLPEHIGVGIKRVLGLPGETIEVREDRVIINGTPLSVQSLGNADFSWVPSAHRMGSTVVNEDGHWVAYTPGIGRDHNSPPVQLGAGEYFLMGDNRDSSLDSREFGPVSGELILGKVVAVAKTGARDSKRK